MSFRHGEFVRSALSTALAGALALGLAACDLASGEKELAPRSGSPETTGSTASAPGTTLAAARSPVDDKTLTVNVRAALMASAALNATTIEVSARDGVVTLSGTTNTSTRRDLAGYLALKVDGVVRIQNRIVVVSST
jgi:osmotically-inducible protein OsmY